MSWRPVDGQAFGAGMVFAAAGGLGLVVGHGYPMGSIGRMGPGAFPVLVSAGLVLIALALILRSFRVAGPGIAPPEWRVLICGVGAILCFGLLIRPAGLLGAVSALTLVMGLARPGARWGEIAAVAAVMTAFCWAVFILGLDAPMTLLGWIRP